MVVVEQEPGCQSLCLLRQQSLWDVGDPAIIKRSQLPQLCVGERCARGAVDPTHLSQRTLESWRSRTVHLPAGEQRGALVRASVATHLARRGFDEPLREDLTTARITQEE